MKIFGSFVKNNLRSIGARTYQALDLAIAKSKAQVSLKDIRIAVRSFLLLYLTILRRAI